MKIRTFQSFLLLIMLSFEVAQADYFRAEFMSSGVAQKRWGSKKFSAAEFKVASPAQRASMAADAVKRQIFSGKEIKKLREELGEPDGYFFSDTILAYQLQVWSEQQKEAWQLVFIPNDSRKVAAVKIQKKCCYEKPAWLER